MLSCLPHASMYLQRPRRRGADGPPTALPAAFSAPFTLRFPLSTNLIPTPGSIVRVCPATAVILPVTVTAETRTCPRLEQCRSLVKPPGQTIDAETAEWIKHALQESHKDEWKYHTGQIESLQAEYTRLQQKIDAAYEDKLDKEIPRSSGSG